MFAILSDIHSNLEALTAVFDDIDAQGIEDVYCLGDVVGYGPDPVACVDLVMERCTVTVKGNHDEALIHGAYGFNGPASLAIEWTRDHLRPGFFSGVAVRRRWEYLKGLPFTHEVDGHLLVHGSPRHPTSDYLLATDVGFGATEQFVEVFAGFERILFVGHTHLPCVITDRYETKTSTELENTYRYPDLAEQKAIVNVGSVGQPRDQDTRACYVVVDGDTVTWRRVEYDYEQTAAKIEAVDLLHDTLAARLKAGR